MTLTVICRQGLLVLAVIALGAAGFRVASVLAVDGLGRGLSALALAASAAVLEALALGLAGLGGDDLALTLAAVATWAAVRACTPSLRRCAPGGPLEWVRRAPPRAALGAGGLAGAAVGWIGWQLGHPSIAGDSLIYHLPIAAAWVQNGRPGSVVGVLDGLPVGNYPVTNEVIVAWGMAISRSWVVASIWSPVLLVALAAGAELALRELEVPWGVRALSVTAVCVMPLAVVGLGGPTTDVAATAWLAVSAGLVLASREQPGLVFPGVLAAALCLGTKTTPALLLAALALGCARPLRAAFAAYPRWMGLALVLAVGVGGVWPLRNLILHGSPLWPLVASPWGDPVPRALLPFRASFLEHPRQLLGAHYRAYLDTVAGGLVLIATALVAPLARRSGPALGAAGAAAVALLAWGLAPYTGILPGDLAVGATRYLLPAITACALAIALAARGARLRLQRALSIALAASIAWSCWRIAALGHTYVPSPVPLAAAAAAGILAAWAARVARRRARWGLLAGTAVACTLGLALAADGYVERHARVGLPDGALLGAGVPGLVNGSRPISSAPGTIVMLRGDRLEHDLSLIGEQESCADLGRRLRHGPVVLESDPPSALYPRLSACLTTVAPRRADRYYHVYY